MKRFLSLLLVFLLLLPSALADPLPLLEDLADTVTVVYHDQDPASASYVYSYRYPHADPTDPTAYRVNSYYEYLVKDTLDYTVPTLSEYYAGQDQSASVQITYEVTCNNDEFFSVLLRQTETENGLSWDTWTGNTFSRLDGMPDTTFDLPRLLGTLRSGESDEWLENRQTEKAREAVWTLVWEIIEKNASGLYNPAYTREDLLFDLTPETDFYLDETGNPVFFVACPPPGTQLDEIPSLSADPSCTLLLFPLSLEDIEDEI